MRREFISSVFLAAVLATGAVSADSVGRPAQKPGPMEYLEVTDELDVTGAEREAARQREAQERALEHQGKREQLGSLLVRHRQQMESFRQRLQQLQVQQRGESEQQEAARQQQQERLQREREALQADEPGEEAS